MNRRAFLAGAPLAMLPGVRLSGQRKPCPAVEAGVADPKFKPGQVWSYSTRPGESGSTLTILQVDRLETLGIVVHIRVDGLHARNGRGEVVPTVEHMPFLRDALLQSVVNVLHANSKMPTMEGYDRWRADCGGAYSIPVADAVSVMEKTLNAP